MTKKIISLIAIFMIFMNGTNLAQEVDEIIKKNIEARGGYDKIKSVNSYKLTGTITTQGMEMPFTVTNKRPNKVRIEATMQNQTMVQCYDGENAWWIFPFMGDPTPQEMPEDQKKDIIEQSDIDGQLVDYKEKGHKLELLGKEDLEGTEVYKLRLTKKNGDIQYWYLDSEYYIELKVTAKRKQGDTEVEVDAYLSDYKEVDGLVMAHSIEQKLNGNTITQIRIGNVETNVEVDDSIFVMPEPKKEEKK